MRILAIDTSTSQTNAAIAENGIIKASIRQTAVHTHSRNLLEVVKNLLAEAGVALDEIDVIAAAAGPGSFTGLRIGLGSIMGLADALNKPVAGAGSLDAIARAHDFNGEGYLCPILNARKGEVYAALYRSSGHGGKLEKLTADLAVPPEELAGVIDGPVRFVGDGFAPYAEVFNSRLKNAVADPQSARPPAEGVAMIVYEKAVEGLLETLPPSPRYVRRSQAEINWELLHTKN
ncbi:MAG: tRNA (adenosine(37)-N6)-threonylcarbamoyltransferase complex dimerization subunit type 1 TsaB [Nitrospinae bacterium]|nr:tRNA (adenosine(37)-N6)-threonylcarbamoyltransferase complex dimerization subunit type 1 TsaB [Nitrospinota bacterium]